MVALAEKEEGEPFPEYVFFPSLNWSRRNMDILPSASNLFFHDQ
jgi:hypothetical protein